MKQISLLILLAVSLVSCSTIELDKTKSLIIGQDLQASRIENKYFSSQPKQEDLKKLKTQGFKTIINLRNPNEYDEAMEKETAKKLGLTYINLVFPSKLELNDGYVDKVYQTIKEHQDKGKLLVHCSSGNRVAIWLGAHFFKHHKFSKEESISTAKELGLTKKKAHKALESYISRK